MTPLAAGYAWFNYRYSTGCAIATSIACALGFSTAAIAQSVVPDSTLSTLVTPLPDGTTFAITTTDPGDRVGNNLFHSFSEFSVPAGNTVLFANPTDIVNVIGRVTGSNSSTIDGVLAVSGTANLFLLNPNGIIFGPDAQLAMRGSFVGSTAESLRFTDGTEFVSSSTAPNPLLTMSAPVGLQLGSASQGISVNDIGYRPLPSGSLDSTGGLSVFPGRGFGLVGSNINFQGGIVTAPAGRIALASVQEGLVGLNLATWELNPDAVQQWGDIQLSQQAIVDVSGVPPFLFPGTPSVLQRGGTVDVYARNVVATDGAQLFSQNFGTLPAGAINVTASETIDLSGTESFDRFGSGISTFAVGPGVGGDINVSAQRASLQSGGLLNSLNIGGARGGNINVMLTDSLVVADREGSTSRAQDGIQSLTFGPGAAGSITIGSRQRPVGQISVAAESITSQTAVNTGAGGNISVYAGNLSLTRSGGITAVTNGIGPGGNVFVSAQDIEALGVDAATLLPSGIGASTTNVGPGGDLVIETQRLRLRDGGRIDASTINSGSAGTINITATESIDIRGTVPGSINPTLIASAASFVDPPLAAFLTSVGIPIPPRSALTGDAGGVTINTPSLIVADGAQLTVKNDGTGDAGTLNIPSSRQVQLFDRGAITASTAQGSGGNINLNVTESLRLLRDSRISAEANGAGDGGNIRLSSPVIVSVDNSDIIASANRGNGGNITISTQVLLGGTFRDSLTPESDITASSQFGVSGVVSLTNPVVNPGEGTVILSTEVSDSSQQIVAGCAAETNQFVASGRGGVSANPTRSLVNNRPWTDTRTLLRSDVVNPDVTNVDAELSALSPVAAPQPRVTSTYADHALNDDTTDLSEANHWQVNSAGDVVLVAENSQTAQVASTDCLASRA